MQRTEANGEVVISCDFCGVDWDQQLTMIEGHHGSVLCLACFKVAYGERRAQPGTFNCTLCLRDGLPSDLPRWFPDPHPAAANPQAIICTDCIDQAAGTLDRDADVDWSRSGAE